MFLNGWQQLPGLRSWKTPGKKLVDTPYPGDTNCGAEELDPFRSQQILGEVDGVSTRLSDWWFGRSFSCQMRSKSLVVSFRREGSFIGGLGCCLNTLKL